MYATHMGLLNKSPCRLVAAVWSMSAPKWLKGEMFTGVGTPSPAVQKTLRTSR